ncbi:16S rRNA (cytosine(1402)-N(4))-methyltransferase RsmH [candidate division NPL-UPA2 bacterium Unc8]|uniref:Ribosomal RNA small subunit methyltransferase H n=1 Tax=candidate division NPL-UPA2 bacterium Unc8 TaxID=1980939 RepID=A0A399FUY2_UNCN2|nr:Ribosomal RNA small subunit methyltransferase H [Bacillota bacterium]MBT9137743.1 Ribosomal RNA small subunit methyltransferase H [Bacillota bacterium]MBT9146777.1 Ribosomal RNA small subunit methyltransferase H [Bacillota bacterium]RIH99766.1 MAG: 16S rRNA (cytosine(1402)-N(4))-methyltransferase RsmH [candidate division NPL-UPA2 bacterium Unc8]
MHVPVLVNEIVKLLNLKKDGIYVDGTVGDGGHAEAILRQLGSGGRLIGIDRDASAIRCAGQRLKKYKDILTLVHGNFRKVESILPKLGIEKVDGFLLDLGVSSSQLSNPKRGFSFRLEGPLDMRMQEGSSVTASHLVNNFSSRELASILRKFGEERLAGLIVKAIVKYRKKRKIETTTQLARIISGVIPLRKRRTHPATKTFQALRIAVNNELELLQGGLESGLKFLKSGGRFVVISYHSLEDRIVKHTFLGWARSCHCPSSFPVCCCGSEEKIVKILSSLIRPSREEVVRNPRSRGAKLRIVERL